MMQNTTLKFLYVRIIRLNGSFHRMGAVFVPKTLYVQKLINYKMHFIIKQIVLHINLTANFKYIINIYIYI